jgi:hypothetical protein
VTDYTAAQRVKRYRAAQKTRRRIRRVEVQVPEEAADDIKTLGAKLRAAHLRSRSAKGDIDFVLGTINAPRARRMDARTLLHCLTTSRPERRWVGHIDALFDEVSAEALHDLVLAGIVEFEDLYRAARTWSVMNGRSVPWIKEMADLGLARSAA